MICQARSFTEASFLSKLICLFTYLVIVCFFVYECGHCAHVKVRGQAIGLNWTLSHQSRWQVPLPRKPSHWPSKHLDSAHSSLRKTYSLENIIWRWEASVITDNALQQSDGIGFLKITTLPPQKNYEKKKTNILPMLHIYFDSFPKIYLRKL